MTPQPQWPGLAPFKPIILQWEEDEELWITRPQHFICLARDGTLDVGENDDVPVIRIDLATERQINQYFGWADPDEPPSHGDVIDYIESHIDEAQQWVVARDGCVPDLAAYLK
jgi:hypothetical protein